MLVLICVQVNPGDGHNYTSVVHKYTASMVFRGGTTASSDTEWPYPFKDKMQYKMISLFEHCYRFNILKRESASTDMSSKHHGPGRPLTE